jgi:3D-(3,5/4)-trihydroxycyclohexane-1,2-dione acylhydrolase (decyclizing)
MNLSEAIIKWLTAQKIRSDRGVVPYFPGAFAIFGHGNALGVGSALYEERGKIPTYRGQTEEGMALAAVGYAKAMRRQQCQVVTTSIGPGALNVVTAAGVALANRLPLLIICGDTFQSRTPDPVLQQLEHFDEPSTSANDAFRAVTRYWDRITNPVQILTSLPQALSTLLDPASCGPVFLGLPQDIQAETFDFPDGFFAETIHEVPRPRADLSEISKAVTAINASAKPIIVSGGGVHYSFAESALSKFANEKNIPVVETMAGKTSLTWSDPALIGPIGVTGTSPVNAVVESSDLIIAVGTRLQDFTTGSWTLFGEKPIVHINVARFDSIKRRGLPVVGDALRTLEEIAPQIQSKSGSWFESARSARDAQMAEIQERKELKSDLPTYAQVVIAINEIARPDDYVMTAAGGLPGELNMNWLGRSIHSFDCEYGFSCMGYEISGAWGAAIARAGTGRVITLVGDGSYLMLNSDIYSAVLHGHPLTIVLCDNGGYGVISRLQTNNGAASFRTMLTENDAVPRVDFVAHAASMGARTERVTSIDQLATAVSGTFNSKDVHLIVIDVAPSTWSEGGAFWEVGVPSDSKVKSIQDAHQKLTEGKAKQRKY